MQLRVMSPATTSQCSGTRELLWRRKKWNRKKKKSVESRASPPGHGHTGRARRPSLHHISISEDAKAAARRTDAPLLQWEPSRVKARLSLKVKVKVNQAS